MDQIKQHLAKIIDLIENYLKLGFKTEKLDFELSENKSTEYNLSLSIFEGTAQGNSMILQSMPSPDRSDESVSRFSPQSRESIKRSSPLSNNRRLENNEPCSGSNGNRLLVLRKLESCNIDNRPRRANNGGYGEQGTEAQKGCLAVTQTERSCENKENINLNASAMSENFKSCVGSISELQAKQPSNQNRQCIIF